MYLFWWVNLGLTTTETIWSTTKFSAAYLVHWFRKRNQAASSRICWSNLYVAIERNREKQFLDMLVPFLMQRNSNSSSASEVFAEVFEFSPLFQLLITQSRWMLFRHSKTLIALKLQAIVFLMTLLRTLYPSCHWRIFRRKNPFSFEPLKLTSEKKLLGVVHELRKAKIFVFKTNSTRHAECMNCHTVFIEDRDNSHISIHN